jgi:hypothetical protein
MVKSFGDKKVGDKSQYPGIDAKANPNQKDNVTAPGEPASKKVVKPEVWNPTGKPKSPPR